MVTFNYTSIKKNEITELILKLSSFYGCNLEFLKEYYFYVNNKGKVHISKINVNELNLNRINSIGVYFGTYHDDNRFRLSLEGTKFIKPSKNYLILNQKSLNTYLSGENLFKEEVEKIDSSDNCPFLIVQYKNENLGCMNIKDNMLLTYMSKTRKLDFNKLF